MSVENIYSQRGVSAGKEDVHSAIKNIDKGIFPNAFCKILPDYVSNDDDYCIMMHADTAGTKTAIAYIYYKETGDDSIWKGIVQDALVMNIDDMICAGATNNFIISSTIGRNKNLIDGKVISAIINGAEEFEKNLKEHGVILNFAGGETADVGDIVRTIDVGYTAFCRMKKEDVINPVNVVPGNVIVSFASYGKSIYEQEENSGIGCNGLTSARHDLLNKKYLEKYPETVDPNINTEVVYTGKFDILDEYNNTSIGKMLLSPTRTFAPLIKKILDTHRKNINAIIHNTGGAQTKCLNYLPKNLRIVKNNLLPHPPIFDLIQQSLNTDWKEMYKVFNMGNRLEIYTDIETANDLIIIANSFKIEAQISGFVEENEKQILEIETPKGKFVYDKH